MELILFILAAWGLTNIIVYEEVFYPIRKFVKKWFPYSILKKILHCSVCCGFWVGFGLTFMLDLNVGNYLFNSILTGVIASGVIKITEIIFIRYN